MRKLRHNKVKIKFSYRSQTARTDTNHKILRTAKLKLGMTLFRAGKWKVQRSYLAGTVQTHHVNNAEQSQGRISKTTQYSFSKATWALKTLSGAKKIVWVRISNILLIWKQMRFLDPEAVKFQIVIKWAARFRLEKKMRRTKKVLLKHSGWKKE